MSQQQKKWIQLVKDKLNEEQMTQTHLARSCGVAKATISIWQRERQTQK